MCSVDGLGTRDALCTPYGDGDPEFVYGLVELLADHDEALLVEYVDGKMASYGRLRRELATQTGRAVVHPVFFGSAVTGAGLGSLISGITDLLPVAEGDADGPVSGTVFKVERGSAGEKIAYLRVFSGTVRIRDRLRFRGGEEQKVTAINTFERGSSIRSTSVEAGQIGKLWGLGDVRIGDAVGESRAPSERHLFDPPTLETAIVPRRSGEKGALHSALGQLADQDPLINLRQDDVRQELYLSLYGEVQKEVIGATLADEFGLDVAFRETTRICIERPAGTGAAVELLPEERSLATPFLATIGLRVEPAAPGCGVRFDLDVKVGSIPLHVYKTVEAFDEAMERAVLEALRQGIYGWEVTDCTVTMTDCDYQAPPRRWPGTAASDFRLLTPLVLMGALKRAGTVVCEPIHRFYLEIPTDALGPVLSELARLLAVPQTQQMHGSWCTLEGEIPAAKVHGLQQRLRALASGEGMLECAFDSYRPVGGAIPSRPRTDQNPLDPKEYLLRVARRV